jgi:alpha-tubulin suppressor-like RCC1 family protein
MRAARERRRIRLARWILIPVAGVVSVTGLAAPAGASAGRYVAAGALTDVLSVVGNSNPDSSGASLCALLSTGTVDCWGYNGSGQLGNGSTATYSDVPVAVTGITDAKAIASDTYGDSFCAVLSTGHITCWGDNGDGQLGNGTITTSDVPVPVKKITTATAVTGDSGGTTGGFCALLSTGHVDCWGDGFSGELGNGTTVTYSDVPVAVHKITNAATLISGFEGFCALLATGHVDCWGDNSYGELGRATTSNYSDVPVAVTGITDAEAVAGDSIVGTDCALLSTGKVKCWGQGGDGQLGNGTTANSDVPVAVTGITDASAVASDSDGGSFCAVLSTGQMKCWGFNNYGQLGNGTTTGSSVPVSVENITTAAGVTGSVYGFCALLAAGPVDCWGLGFYGELGNGTTAAYSDVPVAVQVITNAATLISGFYGFCALLATSDVDCWGYNDDGQLGNGTTTSSDVPVAVLAAS